MCKKNRRDTKIPKTILVAVNYNNASATIRMIEHLKINDTLHKIQILDNGSQKDDYLLLKSYIDNLHNSNISLVRSSLNLGLSKGLNALIKKNLDFDYFLVANNDIIITNKTISSLQQASQKKDDYAVCAPLVYFLRDGKKTKVKQSVETTLKKPLALEFSLSSIFRREKSNEKYTLSFKDIQKKKEIACNTTTSTCMLVPKKVFEKIGFFDNRFFLFYEDLDFYLRLRLNKIPLFLLTHLVIWHPEHSSSSDGENDILVYYRIKGSFLFYAKYKNLDKKKTYLRNYFCYVFLKFFQSVFTLKLHRAKLIIKAVWQGLRIT